jgi:L-ascorbate metabolism protein UlaG (beta-lactamase superfamily)
MNITWHGLSCFEIQSKSTDSVVTIVTDPYENTTGLRMPKTIEAHIALISHDEEDANNIKAIQGDPRVFDVQGEFEVRNVFVYSISTPLKRELKKDVPFENLAFRLELEGLHVAHLGALDRPLKDEELALLENIDILMLPVGGGAVLTPKLASEVIAQVEPRIVIPMTHHLPNQKTKLESVDAFCKELGSCRKEEHNKFKISRKDLPEEDMLIVILKK